MNKDLRNPEAYIRSVDNPNGLFQEILDPSFTDRVPDFHKRLSIATADIEIFATDVAGADREISNVLAARAVQEVLAATAITLDKKEWDEIFSEANRLVNLKD